MAATKKKSAGKRRTPASKKEKASTDRTFYGVRNPFMDCSGCFCRTFNQ